MTRVRGLRTTLEMEHRWTISSSLQIVSLRVNAGLSLQPMTELTVARKESVRSSHYQNSTTTLPLLPRATRS